MPLAAGSASSRNRIALGASHWMLSVIRRLPKASIPAEERAVWPLFNTP
ncbi:hypothetical protein JOS77_01215 [Chromobacterium haemolyticum]|nr:hypothetical protein JOS77_01215 [Chromobacterium haemolyticum]